MEDFQNLNMSCFEILVAETATRRGGGPFIPDDALVYDIPDAAQQLLEPILEPYGQDPNWYFEKLNYGRPPAPWALVCLDQEYTIAGHIATSRPEDSEISFSPYTPVPTPRPTDFVPGVGVIVVHSKQGLGSASDRSPLFHRIWAELQNRSADTRWLIVSDPLPHTWLSSVTPSDRERWLSAR